ncbi:site-specific DNA-methyltransferase [Xanthobacter versatilis]|uniref:site-specific DNA-methyltransferase n=1 Tax=Xanthobacter autotrophicus (strain ATCC BAA-1158 / Py2) TaxID=78245 RepID=UPI00372C4D70
MTKKQKLELTWVGKENRPRLEPRILLEDPEKSYHAATRVSDDDIFDNRLIFGDNLLALKALEQEFAGKVKCVFIDPPYNTGSAFEHYDDGLEHSIWLGLMRDRLEVIRRLLSEDGSLWVTLDDNEAHYFKVMCDEVFGRACFISNIVWRKRDGAPNDRKLGAVHDHILVYAKSKDMGQNKTKAELAFNLMERTEKADSEYRVFEEPSGPDPRGPFRKIDMTANAKGGRHVDSLMFAIRNPYTGADVFPRAGTNWRHNEEEVRRLQEDGRLFWGKTGTAGTPMRKLFKSEAKSGMSSPSIWDDVGLNQHAARELELLFGAKATFETPKPEFLMRRIIQIATSPGDLILDSFAGSGTTGAVAHKMHRRWIMVELGEHCHTHIIPRLKKVIDGDDKGGVTEATGWQGGGGFRYFKLAPSLLETDKWGREIISKAYNAEMLAEALCKIEGFTYAPSDSVYWQHGTSTERDFIYVTTQTLSPEQLDALSEEVGEGRTLLVLCAAFRGNPSAWPNLTVKKIPNHIRERCEWGHDDYSLNVENLPKALPAREASPPAPKPTDKALSRSASQPGLFDLGGDDQ